MSLTFFLCFSAPVFQMYASVCCFGDYDWWSSGLEADDCSHLILDTEALKVEVFPRA
ncbi:predicted protein [Plenodomus lingam JN3]|uniref:Predicted protein n=1 Tax=Leptosphaeria maculans (strain JN3 / isolate v23.1.3 / race Av1-4-5-6-7-8) TaxID=985895 RepID=E5A4A3_LEPMJ|nr:predicted protein [Plenodomus lingam JN3]CBX98448.1 predicted protein [Plenodomus lingam JN3]